MLRQIAEATGGLYQPLGQQSQGLETIYQQGLSRFTRHELASRSQKVYLERFQWPLALGLFCLALEPLLGIRRRAGRMQPVTHPSRLVVSWNKMARPSQSAAVIVGVALFALARPAHASVGSAEKAFQKGDYARAEREYRQAAAKSPDQPVLQFNHGAAAYKAGQFEPAAQSFGKATGTGDPTLREDNYYNLGNAQYRLGQKTEQAKPDETIKTWQQAVQSYEAALKIQQEDADAKYNRDLVKRKIEELKKKQQQQQQQQQQNQKQRNQDQKDQKDQNQQNNQPNQSSNKDQNQNQNQGQNKANDQPKQKQQNDKNAGGSGQQPQSAPKNDQNQNQNPQNPSPSQSGQKPDQSKQQAGNQNQPPQIGQNNSANQPDRKDQADGKSGRSTPEGQAQARNPQPAKDSQDQADVRPEPGKMSREEARQLLDSLKGDDRQMPLTPSARGNESARNDEPVKDW
jgi:Ca-activated chloride channel family protein